MGPLSGNAYCKLGYIGGQPDDDDSGQYRGNPPLRRDTVETRRRAPDRHRDDDIVRHSW